jgi:WD40 repeat protein
LFLVAGYGLRKIEIRRAEDGSLVRSLDVPEMGFEAVWSADGKNLIAAQSDNSVRVWDWPSMGAPRLVLRYHRAEPTFLATDPSGRWLVTSGWDNQSFVVDLHDGRLLLSQAAQQIFAAVVRPAFLLINEDEYRLVELEPAFAFEELPMHERDKSPRDLVFSATGRWLATGGPDGIRILDWASREVLSVMDDESSALPSAQTPRGCNRSPLTACAHGGSGRIQGRVA